MTTGRDAHAIITVADMRAIDARSAELGVPTRTLMENAGIAVAAAAQARWSPRPTIVLCGPGNNGGDGFVAARKLTEAGWPLRVAFLGDRGDLAGDARDASSAFMGWVDAADPSLIAADDLVIDALFGAGLSRPLDGLAAALAEAARPHDTLAVDVPSGAPGDGEAPRGPVVRADLTATFVRKKPAHVLEPCRSLCGDVVVADIGVPEQAIAERGIRFWENGPDLWDLPWPAVEAHKHARGHAVVVSGPAGRTGAARLAARGALRAGAGLVTLLAPKAAMAEHAAQLNAIMLAEGEGDGVGAAMSGVQAAVIGPALGVTKGARASLFATLAARTPAVIDADGLTLGAAEPEAFFAALGHGHVLTPHPGEFRRLFPDLESLPRVARARQAAARAGCTVLLKGPDTIIAAPNGDAVVNGTGTPFLATAGSGDVLAGMIAGLMAQGMDGFSAACAGAWLHGRAGEQAGPGLVAEDLPEALPAILNDLAPVRLRRR